MECTFFLECWNTPLVQAAHVLKFFVECWNFHLNKKSWSISYFILYEITTLCVMIIVNERQKELFPSGTDQYTTQEVTSDTVVDKIDQGRETWGRKAGVHTCINWFCRWSWKCLEISIFMSKKRRRYVLISFKFIHLFLFNLFKPGTDLWFITIITIKKSNYRVNRKWVHNL